MHLFGQGILPSIAQLRSSTAGCQICLPVDDVNIVSCPSKFISTSLHHAPDIPACTCKREASTSREGPMTTVLLWTLTHGARQDLGLILLKACRSHGLQHLGRTADRTHCAGLVGPCTLLDPPRLAPLAQKLRERGFPRLVVAAKLKRTCTGVS